MINEYTVTSPSGVLRRASFAVRYLSRAPTNHRGHCCRLIWLILPEAHGKRLASVLLDHLSDTDLMPQAAECRPPAILEMRHARPQAPPGVGWIVLRRIVLLFFPGMAAWLRRPVQSQAT